MPLTNASDPSSGTNIGEVIRAQREGQRMTQAELARAIGVSSRTLGSYERGVIEPPLGLLPRIGRALGVRFVDDGAGRYQALDAVPEPPEPAAPTVVVIVASTAEAMNAALDRAGVPRAD